VLKTGNKQIYEEAAEWLVDLRVGDMDAAAHKQLDAWFRESPHHIRAFLELSAFWEETEGAELDHDNSTESLIARARASTNVVTLEREGVAARRQGASSSHRRSSNKPDVGIVTLARFLSWRSAVLASVVLAFLGFGLVALKVYGDTDYATGTGEQRTVRLTDGSTIELNSRSRVRVLFSERERDVELVEGQSLFRVAKDHARPFVVRSAGTRVRAVGTQFDVYRKPSGTQVTVVEGRVAVFAPRPPKTRSEGEIESSSTEALSSNEERLRAQLTAARSMGEAPAVLVSTGEQVTVTNQEVPEPHRADLRAATAWTQRELVFDMTPLGEVVQEFNRYNTRKLVISDPALAELHVTGVFSSTDPASLLRFLRAQRGIDVVEAGREIRISQK
jgi:transmembrane sensor